MTKENIFVTVEGLSKEDVLTLIERGEAFKQGSTVQLARPLYAMNLFFENSTRTHTSFDMAERRLGMNVINFDPKTSSTSKGESLYDTVKTLESIGVDLAVIRHQQNNYYEELVAHDQLNIGIINGGDGSGQHPSQCLLDMMTIYEAFGKFEGLKVVIVGDITNSRVARSNAMLLNKLGAEVYFSGPELWWDPSFGEYGEFIALDKCLPTMDVVMLLRVQHERHVATEELSNMSLYHQQYGLTKARYNQLKESAIIMHPAPVNRGVEIDSDLVESAKSRIFKQMQNGVWMRMAMIEQVLTASNLLVEGAD